MIEEPDWQRRVRVERDELNDKIVKLHAFINTPPYESLSRRQRVLLAQQLLAMNTYEMVLSMRLVALKEEAA